MNDKKIAFIICVNNELYYQECLYYIEKLRIPFCYTVDVLAMREEKTICQAYNRAMKLSDAKYKIYMHQDVFIINPDFLDRIITFFPNHKDAGLVGVLGCSQLPARNTFYENWDVGNVYACNEINSFHNEMDKNEMRVKAIDGMIMVTQYDISWREDRISGWDFYDFSQSLEFQRNGYEVWVAGQSQPWCIHDCGLLDFTKYDENRNEFLIEYGDSFITEKFEALVHHNEKREHIGMMLELKENLKQLMFTDKREEVKQIVSEYYNEDFIDTEWVILKALLDIDDKAPEFLADCNCWQQAYQKYVTRKFMVWRERFKV